MAEDKLCVSFVNIGYGDKKLDRPEAYQDKYHTLFSDYLDFTPYWQNPKEEVIKNVTQKQLDEKLNKVVDKLLERDTKFKYVAVFISSHGGMGLKHSPKGDVLEHFIRCVDDSKDVDHTDGAYHTFAMLDKFNIEELKDVVKIFIMQICSDYTVRPGDEGGDKGVYINVVDKDSDNESDPDESNRMREESQILPSSEKPEEKLKKLCEERNLKEPQYISNPDGTCTVTVFLKVGYTGRLRGDDIEASKLEAASEALKSLAASHLDSDQSPRDESKSKTELNDWCKQKGLDSPSYSCYKNREYVTCVVTVPKEFRYEGSKSGDKARESAAEAALSEMKFDSVTACIPNSVVAFASAVGKTGYGTQSTGGWLPAALRKELKGIKTGEEISILSLLTGANQRLSKRANNDSSKAAWELKATGTFHHQLMEKVLLKVVKEKDPNEKESQS